MTVYSNKNCFKNQFDQKKWKILKQKYLVKHFKSLEIVLQKNLNLVKKVQDLVKTFQIWSKNFKIWSKNFKIWSKNFKIWSKHPKFRQKLLNFRVKNGGFGIVSCPSSPISDPIKPLPRSIPGRGARTWSKSKMRTGKTKKREASGLGLKSWKIFVEYFAKKECQIR